METLLRCIHLLACIFLILVVLVQSGRGGGIGAAMGAASGQIFGGRGAGSFLSRLTSGAATVFFCTSLGLSMIASRQASVLAGQQPAAIEAESNSDDLEEADEGSADADAADAEGEGAGDDAALPEVEAAKAPGEADKKVAPTAPTATGDGAP